MKTQSMPADPYGSTLRRLHLVTGLLVIALAGTGFSIYWRHDLGLQAYKMQLLTVHVYIAYTLIAVVAFRIFVAFRSPDKRNSFSRGFIGLGFFRTLRRKLGSASRRQKLRFGGRSLLSRSMVTLMGLAFLVMMATGLFRAGTDLYHWPLGPVFRSYLAADGIDPGSLVVGSEAGTRPAAWQLLMKVKVLIGKIHIYTGFFIVFLVSLHALGGLLREWRIPGKPGSAGFGRLMLLGPRTRPLPDTAVKEP